MASATASAVNGACDGARSRPAGPDGDFAVDADANEIVRAQRRAALVNAFGKYAATAGMRDVKVSLHHRAGAADLVADQRAEMGRQQIVDGVLNLIAFR